MKIPTPSAEELKLLCGKLGSDENLTNDEWVIIAACVASIAMLQMFLEGGVKVGPFEIVDDGRPPSVIEAILTAKLTEAKP